MQDIAFSTSPGSSIVEILRHRSEHDAERLAFIFLRQDGTELCRFDYARLDRRARAIAARLQREEIVGQRVLIATPPGPDYVASFYACLYAGAIPVPIYPPASDRGHARLTAIAKDSGSTLGLTASSALNKIKSFSATARFADPGRWGVVDEIPFAEAENWRKIDIDPNSLAFLQYTSGSTGDPKGVMVSHRSLLLHLQGIGAKFELGDASTVVGWLPPFHDMGLVALVLQPVFSRVPAVVLPPAAFLQKPVRWLKAISDYKATCSGAPNFAYDLCVDKISAEQKEGLDLSRWSRAFCGAEPVHAATWRRFSEAFESCGFTRSAFYPCYGLAESIVMVAGADRRAGPASIKVETAALSAGMTARSVENGHELLGCGGPLKDHQILIVDPATRERRHAGEIGEIWVSGPSLANGYWRDDALTREKFQAHLANDKDNSFLRTGDLGFLSDDNELFVAGRIKDVIIVRGRNIYPHDVERAALHSHDVFRTRNAAAFSIDVSGSEGLGVVLEARSSRARDLDGAIAAARAAITEECGVEPSVVMVVKQGSIPLTSSGKVRRGACKEAWSEGRLRVILQRDARNVVTTASLERGPASAGAGENRSTTGSPQAKEIETWLIERIAERQGIAPSRIDAHAPFSNHGLGSVEAVELAAQLEVLLDRPVSATIVWEHPTIANLAAHLAGAVVEANESSGKPQHSACEPIAIIGIGCRFPQSDGPEEFWSLLRSEIDPIQEPPHDRHTIHDYCASKAVPQSGGFLDGVDKFDAAFFSISPREARYIDPQQRLLLEVAWHTLEDAGLSPRALAGARGGVYVGVSSGDYGSLQFADIEKISAYSGTGCAHSVAANRLSYFLDWRGPSFAVDTACSSSLVATHLACQALRSGECDIALAGGVNVILTPQLGIAFQDAHMMAADGRCKTFDASADGYVRSEGCGLVALKRLTDAQAAGDRIIAIIRGSAQNQDGRSNGLTAPSGQAQQNVITAALADARVEPERVGFVETHGTGTPLGDPIEVRAIAAALGARRQPGSPVFLGAVKTNIGHLEAAAGVAGLIKAALCLSHREIPANLHFHHLNPHIDLEGGRLRVADRRISWGSEGSPRIAGVSSFGFGGANAHVILEEAPEVRRCEVDAPVSILPISAPDRGGLEKLANQYADFIEKSPEIRLTDICFTAAAGRAHFNHRLSVVAADRAQMTRQLRAFCGTGPAADGEYACERKWRYRVASDRPSGLTFLFSETLADVDRAAARLYAEQAVFRSAFDQCRDALERWAGAKWSDSPGNDLGVAFREATAAPLLTALQYALASVWRSWGIDPTTIVARGVGQFAAACISETLRIDDAIRLAAASSPQEFSEALRATELRPPRRTIIGAGEGAQGGGEIATPDYWLRLFNERQHARTPDRSDDTNGDIVLEIGVDAKVVGPTGESPSPRPISRGTKTQDELLYSAVSELYVWGFDPTWTECFAQFEARRVSIPRYSFNRQSYWLEPQTPCDAGGSAGVTIDPRSLHPLLDRRIPTDGAAVAYEKSLRPSTEPLVDEHRAWSRALFPAAGFVEAALAAARYSTGAPSPMLMNVVIARPLVWEKDEAKTIRFNVTSSVHDPNLHQLRICSDRDGAAVSVVGKSRTETMRLEIQRRGLLDSLATRPAPRRAPGPGEIEIEVRAAGLNFMDVMNSMDLLPCDGGDLPALGAECAGVVSAVGSGVQDFAPGQSIMAIAPGSFSGFVTTSAALAVHKPAVLDFEQAAGTPIAFLTAYYALVRLGRLCAGECVLIHSAAGGVGLAAVQIAHKLGARVFATVGNPEKQEILRSMGVEFIAESRGVSFAERVREWTQGRGVDLVLNSLSGDSIAASLSTLAPYGRFLEIGKTDIYRDAALRLFPFRQNLSYFAIDLNRMCQERPALVGELMRETARLFDDGWLVASPHKTWPLERAAEAFRHMAMRKNVGKIVLRLSEAEKPNNQGRRTSDYARATVMAHGEGLRLDPLDAHAVLRRCPMRRSGAEIYESFARAGLEYGPCFRGVDWVQYNDREMLAQIRLTPAAMARKGHILHPALLDSALQAFGASFLDPREESSGEALYAPVAFERLYCHREPPSVVYCYGIRQRADGEILQGDLRLVTQTGEAVAVAEGVVLRRITRMAIFEQTPSLERPPTETMRALAPNWVRRLVWKEARLGPARSWQSSVSILLEPPGDLCELVATRLERLGEKCVRVRPGEEFADLGTSGYVVNPNSSGDFDRLLDALLSTGRSPTRVLHMWTCAPPTEPASSLHELERRLRLGAHSLLFLVKAMAKAVDAETTFFVASANSQAADDDARICPERASLWAIAKTIPKEFARFSCRGVDFDLSEDSPMSVAQGIVEELTAADGREGLTLRRGRRRLISELQPASASSSYNIEFRPGDVILLTGGRGGVGLALARFIAEQAPVRFAFVSRSPANLQPDSAQAIARLEKLGCEVMTFTADVADLGAMREVTSVLRARWGRIDGVIHCAGVLRDGLINSIDGDWFDAPLRPKVHGSWALDQATRDDDLRFFIFTSSMAAIAAPAGQCNHSAANAFEDAFAHALARRGRHALSINWGPWGETGVIANDRYRRLLRAQGVHPFSTEEALAGFAAAIRTGLTQIAVYAMEERRLPAAASKDRGVSVRQSQTGALSVEALANKIGERAAALRVDLELDRYLTLTKKIEDVSEEFVFSAMRDLGWEAPRDQQDSDSLAESLGVAPQHRRLFERWRALISQAGGPLAAR